MEITLKRASVLIRAAREAAERFEAPVAVDYSVHDSTPLPGVISRAREELAVAVDQSLALLEACFRLRQQVDAEQGRAGIRELLARREMLVQQQRRIGLMVTSRHDSLMPRHRSGGAARWMDHVQLATLEAQAESRRTRLREGREDVPESVPVPVLDRDTWDGYERRLAALRAGHDSLQERLTALNHGTRITLDGALVDTLRRHAILP